MGDEHRCPDRVVNRGHSPIAARPAASSQLILAKPVAIVAVPMPRKDRHHIAAALPVTSHPAGTDPGIEAMTRRAKSNQLTIGSRKIRQRL
jgi:hypothetical protein